MAALLKQSTTVTIRLGPFLDATNGVSEEVGLGSMGIEISKNHGAFAARNSATATAHDAEGWYSCELNATDTNTLGKLIVKAHDSANHLPVWMEFQVVAANIFDSLIGGTDLLDISLAQWLGTAPNALVTGRVESLVGSMSANVLTATAINTGAITSAKFASGAITSTVIAASAIGSGQLATDAITSDKIAANAITSAKIAAAAITATQAPNLDAAITTRATPAQVNTEVADVIKVDTSSLPGQAAPPATPTIEQILTWIYKMMRNKIDNNGSVINLYDDAGSTVDAKATVSEAAGTVTREEFVSGP